jgi:hypothetical protein
MATEMNSDTVYSIITKATNVNHPSLESNGIRRGRGDFASIMTTLFSKFINYTSEFRQTPVNLGDTLIRLERL